MRIFATALIVAALAAAIAWQLGAMDRFLPSLHKAVPSILGKNLGQISTSGTTTGPTGVQKCLSGDKVLYTNDKCPAGYIAAPVKGSLTVVSGPAVTAGPAASSSVPNARQLLGAPNDGALREKMIEQAVGK